jgi:hypothetical protein
MAPPEPHLDVGAPTDLAQGTNSITWANSVLPTFMRHSRSSNPESIANERHAIQIVDTNKTMQTTRANRLDGGKSKLNRTVVLLTIN